jgi:hypothetical protein
MAKLGMLDPNGRSIFFGDDGRIKKMSEVIQILRGAFKGMRLDDVEKSMHKIFGEQGGRAAFAIYKDGKGSWEETGENMAKAMALDQRIQEQLQNIGGRFEQLMGNVQNLSSAGGGLLGNAVGGGIDRLIAAVDWTAKWVDKNPELAKSILWIITSLGIFKLSMGGFNILRSILFALGGDFKNVFLFLLRLGGGVQNLKAGFDLMRASGMGIWSSLWQGAQLAWPWLGKISGWVSRFVIQWIIAAGRIGAGWLIAMGPVGWIILGVTAIIAAAVWAWNTNFMGFRDKCIWIWDAIANWGRRTWDSITGWVNVSIGRIGGFIDRVREALGLSQRLAPFSGPIRGATLSPDGFGGGKPPFVGGNRSNTSVTNTVNVNVPTRKDANEFVADLDLPGKYKGDDYNPKPQFGR